MHAKIKLNVALRGNPKGSILGIEVYDETNDYDDYIPIDIYWRRRLKDAEVDNCIEFVYPEEEIFETETIDIIYDEPVVEEGTNI